MKFHLNITYSVEAESLDEASEIVTQIVISRSYSYGSAKVTGYNLHEQYVGNVLLGAGEPAKTPEGADPDNNGDNVDDEIPF